VVGLLAAFVRDVIVWSQAPRKVAEELPIDEVTPGPTIAVRFHEEDIRVTLGSVGFKPASGEFVPQGDRAIWEPSMRFGLVMVGENPRGGKPKRLTFEEMGTSNNTCVRLNRDQNGIRSFRCRAQG
jgi:hypothetical protein